MANNPYLMVRSRSEYYTSMSVSGLPTFLISVKNMNLLSSSIYKHLKTYLIKHKQSLILGPVNPPPFRGSLPRKSLISRMDWVSCAGDINLPHTPFPPPRSPPNNKNQVQ